MGVLAHLSNSYFDRKCAFVASSTGGLVWSRPQLRVQQQPSKSTGLWPLARAQHGHQLPQAPANQLNGREAEYELRRWITGLDNPAIVDRDDALRHVVEHRSQVCLAFAESRLSNTALRHFIGQLIVECLQRLDRLAALAGEEDQREAQQYQRRHEHTGAKKAELRVPAAYERASQPEAE